MKVQFRGSFLRDLKKIKDSTVRNAVQQAIEKVEASGDLFGAGDVKKNAWHQELLPHSS